MKKLFSFLLCVMIIMSVVVVPAHAETLKITDQFLSAVRDEHHDNSIQLDDIHIMCMGDLKNGTYLVKYGVGDGIYTDDMVEIGLGNYTLSTSRPVPVVYAFGKLFDLEYAYENGIIGNNELEIMLTFDWFYMKRIKITKQLNDARSDYQDDDYIFVRFTLDGSEKELFDFYEYGVVSSQEASKLYKAYCDNLHEKLINEVLKDVECIDYAHNNGISIVGIKKKDISAIAKNEFVMLMDYISEVHLGYIDTYDKSLTGYRYKELANCYDENGNLSYVLINAHGLTCSEACVGVRVGDVVLWSESIYSDFTYQYGLFDVKENKFYDIFDVRKSPEKYYKLEENLVNYAGAYSVGDSDGDGEVTIMDATKIQLYLAGLERLEYFDHNVTHADYEESYVSDVDNDGHLTILDATAIQLKLAKI